jgi:uncharacterized protein with gpF-like domain
MPLILPDIKTIKKLEKSTRSKKANPIKPSVKVERDLTKEMNDLWKRVLLPASDRIKRLVEDGAPASQIADTLDEMLRSTSSEYSIMSQGIVERWMMSLDENTRRATNSALKKALGVDTSIIFDDPIVADAITIGSMEASSLIKTIPNEYLGKVARAVMDNFTGKPLPQGRSLTQQIQTISKQSYKHAKMIARDQTGKMTSMLNQTRQQSIGISEYIWKTAHDSRVVGNPSGPSPKGNEAHGDHYHMEGKYCRWDDPTVYSDDKGLTWKPREARMPKNAPGQDILCRCHAVPIIDVAKIASLARQE